MWTMETRIELVAPDLADYRPTRKGRRHAQPLIQARDAILEACDRDGYPLDYDRPEEGAPGCSSGFTAEEIAALDEHYAQICPTCGGRGSIPIGAAGNSEMETNCPECTPDWR